MHTLYRIRDLIGDISAIVFVFTAPGVKCPTPSRDEGATIGSLAVERLSEREGYVAVGSGGPSDRAAVPASEGSVSDRSAFPVCSQAYAACPVMVTW